MERQIVLQKDGVGGQRKSTKSWVGGTSIANLYGNAGIDLESGFSTLVARKSWFMFQKEIIALGAGISSTDNRNIETIIENRKLKDKCDNNLIIDGEYIPSSLAGIQEQNEANWIHLAGSKEEADIGYYFPCGSNIKFIHEKRQGAWKDINVDGPSSEIERSYLTMWIDHGINPINDSYSYVILPNTTSKEVMSYAKNPEITILENRKEVQAVKNTRLNIIGINFWEDAIETVEYITCHKKASIMIMEAAGSLEISLSDPTMENEGAIYIELDKVAKGMVYTTDEVVIERLTPTIKFSVNVKGAKGKTFNMKFSI
jgi:hyaluronate lyase